MSNETLMSSIVPLSAERPKRVVVIDVRRHPDKMGDAITALGEQQIRAVARRDHSEFTYHLFGFSGANRTDQTIRTMMYELRVPDDPPVRVLPGLHYGPAMTMAGIADADFAEAEERVLEHCREQGRQDTVGDWFRALPSYAAAARLSMTTTLMNLACELAYSAPEGETPRALLASHSPMAEMAVTNMEFPRLPVSAGVSYMLVVENGQAQITDCKYLEPADDSCITAAASTLLHGAKK
jgi:hypothetical protein